MTAHALVVLVGLAAGCADRRDGSSIIAPSASGLDAVPDTGQQGPPAYDSKGGGGSGGGGGSM